MLMLTCQLVMLLQNNMRRHNCIRLTMRRARALNRHASTRTPRHIPCACAEVRLGRMGWCHGHTARHSSSSVATYTYLHLRAAMCWKSSRAPLVPYKRAAAPVCAPVPCQDTGAHNLLINCMTNLHSDNIYIVTCQLKGVHLSTCSRHMHMADPKLHAVLTV